MITGKEFANAMHSEAVIENIDLRQLLAEMAVAHDAQDLAKIVAQIKVSDARVKTWQDRARAL